ncbi:MAG TPA: fatty acid desaturase, partial [Polyangiaceae bacterium]|nr:fatty acid desaturase [Polyangiaceae bacterium]
VGNVMVMAHIVTNHGLSPLDTENDPLKSSLSVTAPRWFTFYTLGFGYHVEHHLLPGVSHRYGPDIQALLFELEPTRYQVLPFTTALWRILRAPRVYADAETLLDPETGARQKTLGARRSLPPGPPSQRPSGPPPSLRPELRAT